MAGLQHRARRRSADRRGFPSASTRPTGARISGVEHLAAAGMEDRRRHRRGVGSPTMPSSTRSTTAPAIPARGTTSSARATTSGRRASSRATRRAARRTGSTRFPARRARLRRRQRTDSARHALRRQDAQGADPPGSQRLRLCHRPHQRPGAVGRPVWAGQFHPKASI